MAINVDAMERRLGKVEQAVGADIKFPRFLVEYVSTDPAYQIDTMETTVDGTDIVVERLPGEDKETFKARANAEIPGDSGVLYFFMQDYVRPERPKSDPKVIAPVEDIPETPVYRDPDYHSDW